MYYICVYFLFFVSKLGLAVLLRFKKEVWCSWVRICKVKTHENVFSFRLFETENQRKFYCQNIISSLKSYILVTYITTLLFGSS